MSFANIEPVVELILYKVVQPNVGANDDAKTLAKDTPELGTIKHEEDNIFREVTHSNQRGASVSPFGEHSNQVLREKQDDIAGQLERRRQRAEEFRALGELEDHETPKNVRKEQKRSVS